jgi:hypothetical protein
MFKAMKHLFLICLFIIPAKTVATNDTLYVNPNPFDSLTVISFNINNTDTISLNIYSITGVNVKQYFNNTLLPAGQYALQFNSTALPNGIYFAVLKINSTKTLNVKLIKTSSLVAVNEIHKVETKINIYPNPTNNILNTNYQGLKTIVIKGLNGQIIKSFTGYETSFSISDLNAGCYLVDVLNSTNTRIESHQIIKN